MVRSIHPSIHSTIHPTSIHHSFTHPSIHPLTHLSIRSYIHPMYLYTLLICRCEQRRLVVMATCGRVCGFILKLLKTIEIHFFLQCFTTNRSDWFVMVPPSFFSCYLSFRLFSSSVFYINITAPFITFKCFLFPSSKLCVPVHSRSLFSPSFHSPSLPALLCLCSCCFSILHRERPGTANYVD